MSKILPKTITSLDWMKTDSMPLTIKPPDYSKILPMPDFSLRKINEFHGVSERYPRMDKEFTERFPFCKNMPTKDPAFLVLVNDVIPKLFSQLSRMDAAWHREVLDRARRRDEVNRIEARIATGDIEQHLFELREQNRITDLRQFFFDRARDRSLMQTQILRDTREESTIDGIKLDRFLQSIRDERKQAEFVHWFLKFYSPTALFRTELEQRRKFDLSLTEWRLAQSIAISPLELILATIQKNFPYVERKELNFLYDKFAAQVNRVYIHHEDRALLRKSVARAFTQIFLVNQFDKTIAKRAESAEYFEHKRYQHFHLNKKIESIDRDQNRVSDYLDKLSLNRELFMNFQDHMKMEQSVVNNLYNLRSEKQKIADARKRFLPITIEGTTQYVQMDPVKFRTQYSLIIYWINAVETLKAYQKHAMVQQIDEQKAATTKYMAGLREHVTRDAETVERLREAMNAKSFWQRQDVKSAIALLASNREVQRQLINQLWEHKQERSDRNSEMRISPVDKSQNYPSTRKIAS